MQVAVARSSGARSVPVLAAAVTLGLALAVLVSGAAPAQLSSFYRRWDGASLMGGYLLNPAGLVQSKENSFTLSVQSSGEDRLYELQLVRLEENGLAGGLLIGGLEHTLAYGVAGRLGGPLAAGVSLQRTGRERESYVYSTNLGVSARLGWLALGAAGRIPLEEGRGERDVEYTVGLDLPALGFTAGFVKGERDPNRWGAVRLGPIGGLTLGYSADFGEDGSREDETTSLKIGMTRYLLLTRKEAESGQEYALGIGVTF